MTKMATENGVLTPALWLGDNGACFEIPVYQRLFAWEKPQFDRLLDDLERTADKTHYLGIITVVKNETGDRLILVDGQQRLTAIAILASLLLPNDIATVSDIGKRLFYSARPEDTRALESVWENGKNWMSINERVAVEHELLQKVTNANMRELILAVWDRKNQGDNNGSCPWNVNVNVLTLLVAELPEAYKEDTNLQNEYFEKMNSSGKQLEPHEVLKIQICKTGADIRKWNAIEDFGKQYQPEEQSGEETGNKNDGMTFAKALNAKPTKANANSPSSEKWRSSPIDFPMFLRHVRALCIPDEKLDTHTPLLELFKDKTAIQPIFIEKMEKYRMFLDVRIIHIARDGGDEKNDEVGDESDFKYWVKEKEETYAECLENGEEIDHLFKQLEMTLFALEDERQRWIIEAFNKWSESDSVGHLTEWLARYLTQGKFCASCLNGNAWPRDYLAYGNHPREQLACLDFFLWALWKSNDENDVKLKREIFEALSDKERIAISKYVPRAHRSVEHFHPQTDENNSSNVLLWSETDADTGVRVKDIFGNLALISAGRNSEYSNLGVAGKSERIDRLVEKHAIESIKLLLMRAECKDTSGSVKDENWTPVQAERHAAKMLRVIKWGLRIFAP